MDEYNDVLSNISYTAPTSFQIPKKTADTVEKRLLENNGSDETSTKKLKTDNKNFPKTSSQHKGATTYGESIIEYFKNSIYPKELNDMFELTNCQLCIAKLINTPVAKIHYMSKNHYKKVIAWMKNYCIKNNIPLPEIKPPVGAINELADNSEDDCDPKKWVQCEPCKVTFTSKNHAKQHYMGKKHQSTMAGRRNPIPKAKDERFGIGKAFVQPATNAEEIRNEIGEEGCKICMIDFLPENQRKAHLEGQKHKKKLKQLGIITDSSSGESDEGAFSEYRTPSGVYYCPLCNITVPSVKNFSDHLESKKHIKKKSVKKEMVLGTNVLSNF